MEFKGHGVDAAAELECVEADSRLLKVIFPRRRRELV
jgi:hypothetical protein